MTDAEFEYLKRRIRILLDLDLQHYKRKQMRRRLDSFIEERHPRSVVAYCSDLEKDPALRKELKDFLTINVSEFFRDELQFNYLKRVILPGMLRKNKILNIWSAGCSNGAEAYSVAMLLDVLSPKVKHRILATDVDDAILSLAKEGGPYIGRELKNVDGLNLHKYFVRSGDGYKVVDHIGNRVEFARHNLLTDEFEKDFDLIICRNVVIYLTDDAKRNLNASFYESLKNGGVIFIGGSEIILSAREIGFESVGPSFYRKGTVHAFSRV
ncbi:MAG: protein-glutamate O-methyltransferase CheR [Chloroflexota bacterium]|nr:protein-glutamate O-methyltransferase CheR [Chloroflexota bacterium]